MGTHAMIGMYNAETGEVEASYVHYDGYVEGVGRTLTYAYATPARARAVASVGYLSALYEDLDFSVADSVHKNEIPVSYESVEQYLKNGYDYCGADYLYLFDGKSWFYASRYGEPRFEEIEMNLKVA